MNTADKQANPNWKQQQDGITTIRNFLVDIQSNWKPTDKAELLTYINRVTSTFSSLLTDWLLQPSAKVQ